LFRPWSRPLSRRRPLRNAQRRTHHRVTERAMRELSLEGLAFLLAHELGHLADAAWHVRRTRVLAAVFSLAGVLMLGGFWAAALAGYFDASSFGGVAAVVIGVVTLGVCLLMACAVSREGKCALTCSRYATTQSWQAHVKCSTRGNAGTPEATGPMTLTRRVSFLIRTRPYRSTRLRPCRQHSPVRLHAWWTSPDAPAGQCASASSGCRGTHNRRWSVPGAGRWLVRI
jgi:hypothetical protein